MTGAGSKVDFGGAQIGKRVEVPEWRRGAEAGLMLAEVRATKEATKVEAVKAPNLAPELMKIIRPEAQPRWLLPSLAVITPQYLEAILRGALVGNHVFQWMLFDLMEDTWPRLVKNLNEVKTTAIAELTTRWRLKAWSAKDKAVTPEAEERARLVQEALFEMPGDPSRNENAFEETLYDVLDALGKGTSILEIEWEVRSGADGQEMAAPRATYWVHPKNYAWDGAGNLGLIMPGPGYQPERGPWARTDLRMNEAADLAEIVPDKFLVAIWRARTGHPLGGPRLRALAWWWCAQNFAADWLLDYAQIFGLPIRWAEYVPGAQQGTIDTICDMLEKMGSRAWAAFPAGTALKLQEASKGANEIPQALMLDRADKQCDLLILGQTLTTEVRREGGSRALGEVHADVRSDVIASAARFAARVINTQMIPAILRLNYGDDGMRPRFAPDQEDPAAAKQQAEVLEIAIRSGVPVPVDYALEALGIPKAEEGEKVVERPGAAGAGGNGSDGNNGGDGMGDDKGSDKGMGNGMADDKGGDKGGEGMMAMGATDKVLDRALEGLTGVAARWLGGVKPFFRGLVAKARDETVSDADFVRALERAAKEMPELFSRLDSKALEEAMEEAMGAAMVNGASRGALRRGQKRKAGA